MLKMNGVGTRFSSDIDTNLFVKKELKLITETGVKAILYRNDYNEHEKIIIWCTLSQTTSMDGQCQKHLAASKFKWLSAEGIEDSDTPKVHNLSIHRYILEVDREYLKNYYPLELKTMSVNDDVLCPNCQKNLVQKCGKTASLIQNLYDNEKYILQYRNLRLHLKLGIKLKKVNRSMTFK